MHQHIDPGALSNRRNGSHFDGKRASSLEKAKALFLEDISETGAHCDQIVSADALISPSHALFRGRRGV
jgi:hypothetical protein